MSISGPWIFAPSQKQSSGVMIAHGISWCIICNNKHASMLPNQALHNNNKTRHYRTHYTTLHSPPLDYCKTAEDSEHNTDLLESNLCKYRKAGYRQNSSRKCFGVRLVEGKSWTIKWFTVHNKLVEFTSLITLDIHVEIRAVEYIMVRTNPGSSKRTKCARKGIPVHIDSFTY